MARVAAMHRPWGCHRVLTEELFRRSKYLFKLERLEGVMDANEYQV